MLNHLNYFFFRFFNIPPISRIKDRALNYWQECQWTSPPPIFNLMFILVQITIYAIDKDSLKCRKVLEFQPSNNKEAWRYFTYSLIHMK